MNRKYQTLKMKENIYNKEGAFFNQDQYEIAIFRPKSDSKFILHKDGKFYKKDGIYYTILFEKNQVDYLRLKIKNLCYDKNAKKPILKEFLQYIHQRNHIFLKNIQNLFYALGVKIGINLLREVCNELKYEKDKYGFKKLLKKDYDKIHPNVKPTYAYFPKYISYSQEEWHDIPGFNCEKTYSSDSDH